MKKSLSSLALAALFAVLLLSVATAHTPTASAATVSATPACFASSPAFLWATPDILQSVQPAAKTCDDAVCMEYCVSIGWDYGFCRGQHCACGI